MKYFLSDVDSINSTDPSYLYLIKN